MTGGGRLVLGERAAAVRRQVGPSAWAALEVLAAAADEDGRAVGSIRDISAELGLSKNAAHRAVRRLIDAGLVAPEQSRSGGGRFESGIYRLDVDASVLHRSDASSAPASTVEQPAPRPTRASRRRTAATGDQLSLLTP
jgi:DNA-binding IclR family transcriptional regulator